MSIYNTLSPEPGRLRRRARPRRPSWSSRPPTTLDRWPRRSPRGRRSAHGRGDRRRRRARRARVLTWDELLAAGRGDRAAHAAEVERRWRAIDARPARPRSSTRRAPPGNPKGVVLTPPQRAVRGREPRLAPPASRARASASPTCPTPTSPSGCSGIYIPQVDRRPRAPDRRPGPARRRARRGAARRASSACRACGRRSRPASAACSRWRPTRPRSRRSPTRWPSGWSTSSRCRPATRPRPSSRRAYDAVDAAVLAPDQGDARPRPGDLGRQRVGADAAGDRALLRRARACRSTTSTA